MLPFGEWAPDAPDLGDKAREALGVIPEKAGYRPFKTLATVSNALTARAQGAAWFRAPDGSTKNFSGDATKLYLLDTTPSWNNVSRLAGGAYATDPTGNWRFAQFGSLAYATNNFDVLQSFDLAAGTNWIAAVGSPSVCQFIGVVKRFLFLVSLAANPLRVNWSGDNNPGTFASSPTTLADFDDVPDGGAITGFLGGEYGLVFQESALQRYSFEGSPTVFRRDKVASDLGATIPNSVAGRGGTGFFCHRSGFHMIQGGAQVVPIGRDRVDRWFWGLLDQTRFNRVTSAFDPINGLYIVSFPSGSGEPDQLLIYNIAADRWSHAQATCELIYSGATQNTSWTIEQLDTFGTIENVPFSFDSSYWSGVRSLLLSGFYTDHKYGNFSGANAAVTIDTPETEPIPGRRVKFRAARPMVDGGAPTLALGYRPNQQASVLWTPDKALTPAGIAPFRTDSRYGRFRLKLPAGSQFQWAQGVDGIDARQAGMR